MDFKTLDDLDLDDKVVLTRVDINVPVKNGEVTDTTRIDRIVPTVRSILAAGGKPVLLAHYGRPKGQVVIEMSLEITRSALAHALGTEVIFADDCTGDVAEAAIESAPSGAVVLLENTRFHPGEEANDPVFAKALAALGDIYCNDAFSAAHRAHASTEGIARHLPACAGRLMQAELMALQKALAEPERPVTAVVGGAKVSTKLSLLGNLIPKVDQIVIGGGMANTFLAAEGVEIGKSLCEHDLLATARQITETARDENCTLILPVDVVVAEKFEAGAQSRTVAVDACPSDGMILDAGPKSVDRIIDAFKSSRTLVWNGPLGAFEIAPFNAATDAAALAAADLTKQGQLLTVAGGGDTVAALNTSGAASDFTYVSTAGGAFLEWLEGKTLPGVAALG